MGPTSRTAPASEQSTGETLVVGEALIDVVTDGTTQAEHVGGSPANVAVGLTRLGHPVRFVTRLGTDERGRRITAHLSDAGVRVATGSDSVDRTSTATACVDAHGIATYDFDLTWSIPEVDVSGVGHLHTGSIAATLEPGASQVLELVQAARASSTISYDPNLRPSIIGPPHEVRSRVEELIGYADVVKASNEDIEWLYAGAPVEQVAALWGQLGPSIVVVTQGPEGALVVLTDSGEQTLVPAPQAQVVDTVGAGDSFMSGLLSGLLAAGLLGTNPSEVKSELPVGASALLGEPPAARLRLRAARLDDILPAVERALSCSRWTIERAGAAAPTRSDLSD